MLTFTLLKVLQQHVFHNSKHAICIKNKIFLWLYHINTQTSPTTIFINDYTHTRTRTHKPDPDTYNKGPNYIERDTLNKHTHTFSYDILYPAEKHNFPTLVITLITVH